MIQFTKKIDDESGIVSKLIFEDERSIAEAVLYRYEDRGVICFSTQSGCPVGCTFCGTGNKFIKNLTGTEMSHQIETALNILKEEGGIPKKMQLMSMSMGEPMLNWDRVKTIAEYYMYRGYYFFISTVGIELPEVKKSIIDLGIKHDRFGLQFSLHSTYNAERMNLFRNHNIPYMDIGSLLRMGQEFTNKTGRRAYFNYIVTGEETKGDKWWLSTFLKDMHLTCSVMCSTTELIKADPTNAINLANDIFSMSDGRVETSTFDPAGQDSIGGGCGMLLYVQDKMSELDLKK